MYIKNNLYKLSRVIISIIIYIILISINYTIGFKIDGLDGGLELILPLTLFISLYLFISYDIILKSLKSIFTFNFLNENTLMIIASIGAFILLEYIEAIAIILFFQIGALFEDYAVNKTRTSITDLMNLKIDKAYKIEGDNIIEVDVDSLKVNDIVLIKVGDKVPCDGILIEGKTNLDLKSLTGESLPIFKGINDEILSGSLNLEAPFKMKILKKYEDSTVYKILELVENSSFNKSDKERFISKFAKYYTPIVVLSALVFFLIYGFTSSDFNEAINRSLNFLVVSCPCALVISVPLTFFSTIGAASKRGILIKGANFIEEFNKINLIAFDKTGTLTKGDLKASGIKILNNMSEKEFLNIVYNIEKNSNHPIAKAIIKNIDINKTSNIDYLIKEIIGFGLIGKDKDKNIVIIGNKKLLDDRNINAPKLELSGTIIYVALNNKVIGYLNVINEIKEEAKDIIKYLKNDNIKTIMLSGDNKNVASYVSKKLALDTYHYSLLPKDKVDYIKKYKDLNNKVCFIGDGINDAPSLILSDIGISMGNIGSQSAIEASDIVFMNDELNNIKILKKMCKKAMIIVNENIYIAILLKILVLILSTLGYAPIWLAIFSDVGVAILAILNAIRILFIKNNNK